MSGVKASPKKEYPKWVDRALQGITYWIGHRRCVYREYHLPEAALVAEVCNLIYANLPNDMTLRCEVHYSELLKGKKTPDLPKLARADLVVSKRLRNGNQAHGEARRKAERPSPKFVIEVKR